MVEVQARDMLLLSREASATPRMIEHLVPIYTLIRSLLAEPLIMRKTILSRIRDDVLPPLAQYLPDPEWFNSVMQ